MYTPPSVMYPSDDIDMEPGTAIVHAIHRRLDVRVPA